MSSTHTRTDEIGEHSLTNSSWWDTVIRREQDSARDSSHAQIPRSTSDLSYVEAFDNPTNHFSFTDSTVDSPTLDLNIKQATKSQLERFLAVHWDQQEWLPLQWQDSSSTCRTVLAQLALATKLWIRNRPLLPSNCLWYQDEDPDACGAFVRAILYRWHGSVPLLTIDNVKRAVQMLRQQFGHKSKLLTSARRYLDDAEGSGSALPTHGPSSRHTGYSQYSSATYPSRVTSSEEDAWTSPQPGTQGVDSPHDALSRTGYFVRREATLTKSRHLMDWHRSQTQ